jgi:hypothetical protein
MSSISVRNFGKGNCTWEMLCAVKLVNFLVSNFQCLYQMSIDMIWYDEIYSYLINTIGLTPGGSSTVHIYTQTVHRTTQWKTIHRTEHIEK